MYLPSPLQFIIVINHPNASRFEIRTTVARTGEMRCGYKVVLRKAEGKKLIGKPRFRWKDNIQINLLDLQDDVFLKISEKRAGP